MRPRGLLGLAQRIHADPDSVGCSPVCVVAALVVVEASHAESIPRTSFAEQPIGHGAGVVPPPQSRLRRVWSRDDCPKICPIGIGVCA